MAWFVLWAKNLWIKRKIPKKTQISSLFYSPEEDPSLEITSEVNTIESFAGKGKQSRKKKKGKGKVKQDTHSKDKSNKNEPYDENKKPRYPCLICVEGNYTECPHHAKVSKFVKSSPTPIVLKDPFPPQDSKMVSYDQSSSSTSIDIMMMSSKVMVAMRSKDYMSKSHVEDGDDSSPTGQTSTSTPSSFGLFHIDNHDMIIRPPPKGILENSTFNPHVRATQNYNIVKDLAMSPLTMSTLEVL